MLSGAGQGARRRLHSTQTARPSWIFNPSRSRSSNLPILCRRKHEIRVCPWALLSAPTREPIARSDRTSRFGLSLSRLERASHRRVLRTERSLPRAGWSATDRKIDEQLLNDKLQFWPHAPVVVGG